MPRKILTALVTGAVLLAGAAQAADKKPPTAAPAAPAANNQPWGVSCGKSAPDQPERCAAIHGQMLTRDGAQSRLLQLTIHRNTDGYVMLALLPLGIHLPAGAAVKLDDMDQLPMILRTCTNAGCEAVMKLSDAVVSKMSSSESMKVGFNVESKTMVLPVPLKGFKDALSKVK